MPDLSDFERVLIDAAALEPAALRAMEQGEIVHKPLRAAGVDGAQAFVLLPFAPEQVWDVITDYASFPRWMHSVRDIPAVEWTNPDTARVTYVMEGPFRDVRYALLRTHRRPEQVRWVREQGDLAGVWGGYDLLQRDDGTLVRYWAFVDPGFWVPSRVRSFFTARGIERLMDSVRRETMRRYPRR